VIFGFLGYLLARGWFERKPASIAVAAGVGLLYGGAIFGVLPGQVGISWQAHLFGFLGGILAARWMSRPPRRLPA
jgi:membrane associated rhomboid family serine protease